MAAVLLMLGISSCSQKQSTNQQSKKQDQEATPVIPDQQTSDAKETEQNIKPMEGKASWYGPGFYGKKTTSGEVLQKGTMTAAHSSLPMGTEVKVTRLDTNESVTVVINDRKPYKEGTLIDLAHGAADALDIDDDGTAGVRIEVID